MKLRKNKKGFTIVELVIVIAVIGVLTAILVPTFVSLNKKANRASDNSLVTNLNTALASKEAEDGAKNATMYDAVEDLREYGFELKNLVAKSEEDLLWSMKENRFYLSDAEEVKSGKSYDFWHIQNDVNNPKGYSIYAGAKFSLTTVDVSAGFDAGDAAGITAVNYTNSEAREVVIRTNGDQTVLTVNAPNDDVNFYGFARQVVVTAVKDSSLHVFGAINELQVTSGHVKVEDTGIVFDLAANTGSVDNSGYIAANTSGTEISGNPISDSYDINSLARLEAFRDVVNSGKDFAGKTVKLSQNIELRDGWKPIGEGYRAVGGSKTPAEGITTFFAGTFDGQGHTISNLNNKGFVPTAARLVKDDGKDTYAYGLFALVSGATIKDVKLAGVAIDTTTYAAANGDSVGALVGYSNGALNVSGIEVSGSIKASDAVGGIVGRCYNKTADASAVASITNCVNKANITAGTAKGQKGAGIVGFVNCIFAITGNTNQGTIAGGAAYSGTSASTFVAGGQGTYILRANIAVASTSQKTTSTYDGTWTDSASSTGNIN